MKQDNAHVLAIKILASSTRLGQLVPRDLSRMKPVRDFSLGRVFAKREISHLPSSRYESVSFPPTFLMTWIWSKSVDPYASDGVGSE